LILLDTSRAINILENGAGNFVCPKKYNAHTEGIIILIPETDIFKTADPFDG